MARPSVERRRVRALSAHTEFVPGYGQVHFNPDSKNKEARHPMVPASAISGLVGKGWVADDLPDKKPAKRARPQLDRDGDGAEGGSKAGDESTAALGAARKRYRKLFGKNAGPRWTVAEIEAKIAEKPAAGGATGAPASAGAEDDAPAS